MDSEFQSDIAALGGIGVVPTILSVICRVTGMGFAAVARVTEDRWVCLAFNDEIDFGLKPGGELRLETTLCREVRQCREAIVIDHVAEDPSYSGHQTPAMYGFQSYISVPIVLTDGSFYGTLCAIDPKPARLKNSGVTGMFTLFADLIALHLEGGRHIATAQADLLNARGTADLREQFIAVLGHDLRNPLASIAAGMRLLDGMLRDEKDHSVLAVMQKSVDRMSALIGDILDFARGRLGGGFLVGRTPVLLTPFLEQVIAEFRTTHPTRSIIAELDLPRPVACDSARIGQLFSNLLGNALVHGAENEAVHVKAATGSRFEITVCNKGEPIPAAAMEYLFQPFARGKVRPDQQGLGLGLYIASEIARAHEGRIDVASSPAATCFTFSMPLPE